MSLFAGFWLMSGWNVMNPVPLENIIKTKMNSFFLVLALTVLLHDPICAVAAENHIAQQAYLKASNSGAGDGFGVHVAISGDTVVVGVIWEASNAIGVNGDQNDNSEVGSGAAYVFVRTGTTWTQQAYLKGAMTGAEDRFGWSVAVSGDTVVVGATGEDSYATGVNGNQLSDAASGSGAAYLFVRTGTTWTQQAYLKASNTGFNYHFGSSVAASGNLAVIGSPEEASYATGVNGNQTNDWAPGAGAVYLFSWPAPGPSPIATINHTPGGVHLTIPVSAGQSIGVQCSELLVPGSWVDLGDFMVTGTVGDYTDNDPARMAQPSGYYRAVLR
jgi:hypothetical protein